MGDKNPPSSSGKTLRVTESPTLPPGGYTGPSFQPEFLGAVAAGVRIVPGR